MKKLIIIIAMILPMALPAATMCSKNDTITIVLDPSIGGTNYTSSSSTFKWSAWLPYGTVRGIAACLSSGYGKSRGGTVVDLHDNGELVVGTETNGSYCWCRMTHPALSLWTFSYNYETDSKCESNCALNCGYYTKAASGVPELRRGLFSSVVQNSLPQ